MWENNPKFVAWLDHEGPGTSEDPLTDETLDLMCRAWEAASAEVDRLRALVERDLQPSLISARSFIEGGCTDAALVEIDGSKKAIEKALQR
jgi:hypothetical protein